MHELEGKKAPAFSMIDQDGKTHALESYLGKWVVLYFYPKDMTPGCTVEACSFRDANEDILKLGAVVFGVSGDSQSSHGKFASKHKLKFPLLVDTDNVTAKAYGSFGQKKFMGRNYEGIYRNTYLINPEGVVQKVYQGVKPAEHIAEVVADLKTFQSV
jgi:peroxiredoxin Q/BCP